MIMLKISSTFLPTKIL